MTYASLPDQRAVAAPHAPAVADDTLDLDNTAFADAVRRAAATLRAAGVGRGDVVAIKLPNTAVLVVAMFAAWRLGAAATPINPSLTTAEVEYQISDAGAKVVVTAHLGRPKGGPDPKLSLAPVATALGDPGQGQVGLRTASTALIARARACPVGEFDIPLERGFGGIERVLLKLQHATQQPRVG